MSAADAAAFRRAMRHYPTGVTVVTSLHEGERRGMTATAFASVSAEPPLVLVCVNREARSYLYIAATGFFCVNLLSSEQQALALRFSGGMRDAQFTGLAHTSGATGAPILDDALAYFDCRVESETHAGSHSVFIGRVVDCEGRAGAPLGYFDGAFSDFGVRAE